MAADRGRRRVAWLVALSLGLLLIAPSCLVGTFGGAFSARPQDLKRDLSPLASELVADALAGIDRDRLLDHHVHIAGVGHDHSGCAINPELTSWWHPTKKPALGLLPLATARLPPAAGRSPAAASKVPSSTTRTQK